MTKSDICREFRIKYPDLPTLTLARILYKEHPMVFSNIEAARTRLRHIEGKSGDKHRKNMQNSEFFKAEPRPYNPYKMPKTEAIEYKTYQLPEGRMGLIADVHVPYHSVQALTTCIDYFISHPIDFLLINGDFFDFYGGSRFMKDPRKLDMAQEIEVGVEILKIIYDALKVPIYFKVGNHDARFAHYFWQKLPEISQISRMFEIADMNLENCLRRRLDGIPIHFIESNQIMDFCGLSVVHGHEFGQSVFSPVNVARGLFLRGMECVTGAHHHQTSEHTQPTMRGKMITTWSVGCIADLFPEYLPINKWNHGFQRIIGEGDQYEMQNKRILGSKVL